MKVVVLARFKGMHLKYKLLASCVTPTPSLKTSTIIVSTPSHACLYHPGMHLPR